MKIGDKHYTEYTEIITNNFQNRKGNSDKSLNEFHRYIAKYILLST